MKQEELNEKVWEEYQALKKGIKRIIVGLFCVPIVCGLFMLIVWCICEGVFHYLGV